MKLTRSLFDGLKVGLLGGSFNPAHDGHREISLMALRQLQLDYVWWLVTPGNPLKEQKDYAPLPERLEWAHSVAAHPRIIVSDFEAEYGLTYTADTVQALTTLFSDTRFVWLMGADSLASFHRWRDWQDIANAIPMAVFNRPGDTLAPVSSKAAIRLRPFRHPTAHAALLCDLPAPAWVYFHQALNPLSATALRQKLKKA
jgi:nicotinate-nucleotide adenylyltransferase